MNELLLGRNFQLWEYCVSHGSLLIRSPKHGELLHNIDIKFFGVEYLSSPRHLKELLITDASEVEVQSIENILGKSIENDNVYILEAQGVRHIIVAAGLKVESNENDIFDSPFKISGVR